MKDSYKKLWSVIKHNEPHHFAALLSRDPNLRLCLLNRYGSTKFSHIAKMIKYGDQLRFRLCPKCKKLLIDCSCHKQDVRRLLNSKSLLKLLQIYLKTGKSYETILKQLVSRLRRKRIPSALTKQQWILWKVGYLKVDRCLCGRLKPANESICYICRQVKNAQSTVKRKYGVDNISQLEEIKKRKVQSWKKNQDKWIQKQKQTMLKKYGVDNPSKVAKFNEKKSESLKKIRLNFEKYVNLMNQIFQKHGTFNLRWKLDKQLYERLKRSNNPYLDYLRILYRERLIIDSNCELLTKEEDFIKQMNPRCVKIYCKSCKRISKFWIYGTDTRYLSCKYCNAYTSLAERWLYDWLTSLGLKVLKHYNRGSKFGEIDLYLPDLNFGIEYQGLIWHANDEAFERDKHKWLAYTTLGVKLFYIYEDDFNFKKPIILSILTHKLNLKHQQKVIYARNCQLKIYKHADKNIQNFFNSNHIHGFAPGNLYLMLEYEEDFVAGMIIGRHRFGVQSSYEIIRYCTKISTHVPGAFSKLFKYANDILQPGKMIFFLDSAYASNLEEEIKQRYNFLSPSQIELQEPTFYVVDLNNPVRKYHRLYASKEKLQHFLGLENIETLSQDDLLNLAGFGKLFRPPSFKLTIGGYNESNS
jgi:Holliday junction resolvase-like predicted endonuclease